MNLKMRTLAAPPLVLVALVGILLAGCRATMTWSEAAWKTTDSSVSVADAFLKYEQEHRASLSPDVRATANDIRRQMPDIVRGVNAALKEYDAGATNAAVQARVEAGLSALNRLTATATAALTKAQQSALPTSPATPK